MRKPRLYVAYGSNLNWDQMEYRCPTARLYGACVLENYRLVFKGTKGCSFADIEPAKGDSVPVLVWDLKPADERALDRYEGFPTMYQKQNVKVRLDKGVVASAMVYIMTDKRPHRNTPSATYYQSILDGYLEFGFDPAILRQALANSEAG